MARFLRDEQVSNLTIDPEILSELVDVFANRKNTMPQNNKHANQSIDAFLNYTIRFDQKGYKILNKEQFLQYFLQATDVERLVFEFDSIDAIETNRAVGSFIDLRLDKNENVACFLTVASDDEDWVNGSFSAIKETLIKCKNRHSWVRNPYVYFLVQGTGIFLGFLVSLWGASKIAPMLIIENSFLISFLLVLLVFSNLWTPINQRLRIIVNRAFPIIKFYRPDKDRLHWLYQAIVGGIVVVLSLYCLGIAFTYVGKMLGAFVGGSGT